MLQNRLDNTHIPKHSEGGAVRELVDSRRNVGDGGWIRRNTGRLDEGTVATPVAELHVGGRAGVDQLCTHSEAVLGVQLQTINAQLLGRSWLTAFLDCYKIS